MEGDYGDRLLKLSQLIVGQDEDGTLAESLSHIPSALETTARAHMDLAQQLQHHLHSPLDSFINEQKDLYTTVKIGSVAVWQADGIHLLSFCTVEATRDTDYDQGQGSVKRRIDPGKRNIHRGRQGTHRSFV
jgi:hypothetical protein